MERPLELFLVEVRRPPGPSESLYTDHDKSRQWSLTGFVTPPNVECALSQNAAAVSPLNISITTVYRFRSAHT